jgi:aminoglycoside phosphotransferase
VVDAPFAAVERTSAVHDTLESLRDLIAEDPGLALGPGVSLRAEVRPRPTRAGRVELSRCYWSVQRSAPGTRFGLSARTLFWDRGSREARIVDLPAEPTMVWLGDADGPLSCHGDGAQVRILRYIPLRRITFRLVHAPGLPDAVVAKSKTRPSLVRATRALLGVRRAAAQAGVDAFILPNPVRLDLGRRLLYLTELPGRDMEELLAGERIDRDTMLHRLGRVHREVHELSTTRVPLRRNEDWLARTAVSTEQIAALAPSTSGQLATMFTRLAKTMPEHEDIAFCHGDFVPSQILCDGDACALLDFDDAHLADPHAEVAAVYVALRWELPDPTPAAVEAARRAYLAGYVERSGGALDPTRWRWFTAVAQLEHLARRFIKGRALPGEVHTVLDELTAGRDGLDGVEP